MPSTDQAPTGKPTGIIARVTELVSDAKEAWDAAKEFKKLASTDLEVPNLHQVLDGIRFYRQDKGDVGKLLHDIGVIKSGPDGAQKLTEHGQQLLKSLAEVKRDVETAKRDLSTRERELVRVEQALTRDQKAHSTPFHQRHTDAKKLVDEARHLAARDETLKAMRSELQELSSSLQEQSKLSLSRILELAGVPEQQRREIEKRYFPEKARDAQAGEAYVDTMDEFITGRQALQALKEGNKRFVEDRLMHPHQSIAQLKKVQVDQHPSAIIVGCSDSRVPLEIIFDCGMGDAFVVRAAGGAVGTRGIGSMEYAVQELGTKLLAVIGHEKCGAVRAAVKTQDLSLPQSPNLRNLVGDIREHLTDYDKSRDDEELSVAVKMNIDGLAEDILTRSQIIREAVERGEVIVAKGVFSLKTGKVTFLEQDV